MRICGGLVLVAASACAQGYLSGPALNKKIVTDFYRLVFEPRNPDLIDQFIAPDFVEHSPLVEGGRDGLVKFLKTLPRPASDEIGAEMRTKPAYVVAEGDLVTFVFQQNSRFSFDLFRIKNGKIVEHWDSATR